MRLAALVAISTVLCVSLAACGGGNTKGQFANNGTYTEPISGDPGNLNPLTTTQSTAQAVNAFAYDTLVNIDPQGRVVSQLAKSWKVTPTSVTYTLRPGITCSDGTPLSASGVARTFAYIKDPKNKSSEIGNGLPSPDFTVRADDAARTVTISMAQPYSFLLEGAGLVPIVCPKGLDNPKTLAQDTDGTGPFELTQNVAGDHLTFVARKGYHWGPNGATTSAPGFPHKVVFRVIQDPSTAANLLLSGQLNSDAAAGADRQRLLGHGFQELDSDSGPNDLFFNERSGSPVADPAVRRALALALDLPQLAKVTTGGSGAQATNLTVLPPHPCPGNTVQGAVPGHDLAAARAALDQAGWVAGSDGIRTRQGQRLAVTLLYFTSGSSVAAGMELVGQWWKQLGVDVKLKVQGTSAFAQTLFSGSNWDVAFLGVAVQYPSQLTVSVSGPPSPKGQNFGAIQNATYARLAGQAIQTPGAAGCALWHQAEQALFRNVDLVPVSVTKAATFVRGARLQLGSTGTEPTSIRLLAH